MSVDLFLARLDRVRRVGAGRWMARCPAHEDRSPSLSVRELDGGRMLVHDFAGCSVEEIVAAVGLSLSDLFPPRPIEYGKPERRPFLPADVFDIARREIGIVAILAADLHKNKVVSEADYERVFVAVERLNRISELAYGKSG